jgi:putative FmdB family regulatory protein
VPIYDYRCKEGHDFTAWAKIAERNEVRCPECGAGSKIQILSAPVGIVFHSGWYDNLDVEPIHCSTPQELRDACDKRDLTSVYLHESPFKTRGTVQDIEREIYADDERKARSQAEERRTR